MPSLLSFLPLMLLTKNGLFNIESNDPQVLCCPPHPCLPNGAGVCCVGCCASSVPFTRASSVCSHPALGFCPMGMCQPCCPFLRLPVCLCSCVNNGQSAEMSLDLFCLKPGVLICRPHPGSASEGAVKLKPLDCHLA